MTNRFRVELNRNWLQDARASEPLGWGVISTHRTLEGARAEMDRRQRQEGRGFEHRVTDRLGKRYD